MTEHPLFLKRNPAEGKWLEWQLQAYIVQELRREGYFIEGDQNAAKRGWGAAAKAKASGMLSGTPDLRIYLYYGRLLLIELKEGKNKTSDSQDEWHKNALAQGFKVYTVNAFTPVEGLAKVRKIISEFV